MTGPTKTKYTAENIYIYIFTQQPPWGPTRQRKETPLLSLFLINEYKIEATPKSAFPSLPFGSSIINRIHLQTIAKTKNIKSNLGNQSSHRQTRRRRKNRLSSDGESVELAQPQPVVHRRPDSSVKLSNNWIVWC